MLPGWTNVDADGGAGVVKHDLRKPFPLAAETVRLIYSEHFIEHVTRDEALRLLTECRRVLAPGGVLRLSTPDLRKLLAEYSASRITEWSNVGWLPGTPCRMVNEAMRAWGHQFVYDVDELKLLLSEAGFQHIADMAWRESRHAELRALECRPFHGEIIVEAVKQH